MLLVIQSTKNNAVAQTLTPPILREHCYKSRRCTPRPPMRIANSMPNAFCTVQAHKPYGPPKTADGGVMLSAQYALIGANDGYVSCSRTCQTSLHDAMLVVETLEPAIPFKFWRRMCCIQWLHLYETRKLHLSNQRYHTLQMRIIHVCLLSAQSRFVQFSIPHYEKA